MLFSNPISLKEDDLARQREQQKELAALSGGLFRGGVERRKAELLEEEREALVRESQERFRERVLGGAGGTYYRASDVSLAEHVKPMFSVSWAPMLAVFSVSLEVSHDATIVDMCLRGFRQAIHISAQHRMETERDAFVTSLAKFTFLDSIGQIQQKNIDCIKALIAVALHEGDHLQQSWGPILNCLSQLARLQLFAAGAKSDDAFFPSEPQPVVRYVTFRLWWWWWWWWRRRRRR